MTNDDIDIGKGVMTRVDGYEATNVLWLYAWTAHKSHNLCWYFVLEVSRSLSEAVRRAFSTFSCNASETLSVHGGDGWGHLPLWNFLSNRWRLFCSTRICFSDKFKYFIAQFLCMSGRFCEQTAGWRQSQTKTAKLCRAADLPCSYCFLPAFVFNSTLFLSFVLKATFPRGQNFFSGLALPHIFLDIFWIPYYCCFYNHCHSDHEPLLPYNDIQMPLESRRSWFL